MRYSPYYSRYINERKRKAKAAYVTKVMAGVVLALAMSSSAFMLVSADTKTLDAALGAESTAEITADGITEYSLEDLFRIAENNSGGNSNRVNLDNPGDNDSPADILNQLYANYVSALDIYNDSFGKYKSGNVSFAYLQRAYGEFIKTKEAARDAHSDAKIYYDSEYAEYVTAMAEYEDEYAKYLMEKSSYEKKLQEYDEAVRANAEAMEQYAKEMEKYAKDMTEYKNALDKWNEFISGGGDYEEAMAVPPENPGSEPKMPDAPVLKSAEHPGEEPTAPSKPVLPGKSEFGRKSD